MSELNEQETDRDKWNYATVFVETQGIYYKFNKLYCFVSQLCFMFIVLYIAFLYKLRHPKTQELQVTPGHTIMQLTLKMLNSY